MEELLNLNDIEKDAIKEVGNVGTGNAATALSKLLDTHIEIIIPETKFIPIKNFADELGGPESIVVSTYLEITGNFSGECLFIFPVKSAEKIVDLMTNKKEGISKITDNFSESAFKEMSNIFTGAYLSSLADMTESRIMPSVPHIATDMLQSIIDFILAKISNYADTILSIKTRIEIKDVSVEGYFIIVFDIASLNKLLKVLGEMYNKK